LWFFNFIRCCFDVFFRPGIFSFAFQICASQSVRWFFLLFLGSVLLVLWGFFKNRRGLAVSRVCFTFFLGVSAVQNLEPGVCRTLSQRLMLRLGSGEPRHSPSPRSEALTEGKKKLVSGDKQIASHLGNI